MMEAIFDYNKDASAVGKEDMYITTKSVQSCIRKKTCDGIYWFNGRT